MVANPNASLEWLPLDLASFASVRECVEAFQAKGYPLQILINPPGCMDRKGDIYWTETNLLEYKNFESSTIC